MSFVIYHPYYSSLGAEISSMLSQDIPFENIAKRKGPGNSELYYVEAVKIIDMANDIFGFDGWASSVIDVTLDYCDEAGNGRINVGVSAIVRVTLLCGNFHEDVGYGLGIGNNKGETLEKAKKEAVTDALKRALRHFGRHLGGSIYDQRFLGDVKRQKDQPNSANQHNFSPVPHRPLNSTTPHVAGTALVNSPMQARPNPNVSSSGIGAAYKLKTTAINSSTTPVTSASTATTVSGIIQNSNGNSIQHQSVQISSSTSSSTPSYLSRNRNNTSSINPTPTSQPNPTNSSTPSEHIQAMSRPIGSVSDVSDTDRQLAKKPCLQPDIVGSLGETTTADLNLQKSNSSQEAGRQELDSETTPSLENRTQMSQVPLYSSAAPTSAIISSGNTSEVSSTTSSQTSGNSDTSGLLTDQPPVVVKLENNVGNIYRRK